jgi:hypothetical protein
VWGGWGFVCCVHTWARRGGTKRVRTQNLYLWCHTHFDTSDLDRLCQSVGVSITDAPVYSRERGGGGRGGRGIRNLK